MVKDTIVSGSKMVGAKEDLKIKFEHDEVRPR
jgi:hypothetical protein